MNRIQFTRKAITDLSDIWEYTVENWSEKQADKYYTLLVDSCSALARNPKLGKTYSEIYAGLFGKLISKHIIFYRVIEKSKTQKETVVEITRILHAQMDLKSKWVE
jgi:toxin ParE1/3/4